MDYKMKYQTVEQKGVCSSMCKLEWLFLLVKWNNSWKICRYGKSHQHELPWFKRKTIR